VTADLLDSYCEVQTSQNVIEPENEKEMKQLQREVCELAEAFSRTEDALGLEMQNSST
jgi:hypothetical protein